MNGFKCHITTSLSSKEKETVSHLVKTYFKAGDKDVLDDLFTLSNYFVFIYNDNVLISFLGATMKNKSLDKAFPPDKMVIDNIGNIFVSTLDLIWVSDNCQGKGLGSKLLSLFEKKGNDTLLKVGTSHDFNYQFYKKHEYHKIATWKKEKSMLYIKHSDKNIFDKLKMFKFTF